MFASIRSKLITLLLLITIIPFGTSIIVTYFYTTQSLKEQAIDENLNLLYQGKVNIETYIRELNNQALVIYQNPDFMNYLKSSRFPTDHGARNIVNTVLQTLLYSDDSINRVYMSILNSNHFVSVSRRSTVIYIENVDNRNQDFYLRAEESPYNQYIQPIYNPHPELRRTNPFTLHRAFTNVPSDEVLAFISLEVNPTKITDLSRQLYDADVEEFYIISQDGSFIFSSQNGRYSEDEQSSWVQDLLSAKQDRGFIEKKEDTFHGVMVYETTSEATGEWILVKRLPYTTLNESAYSVAMINILFGVIGLVLVILATFLVSFQITKPIKILVQNIRQVEKGNMKAQFKSLGNDEIGLLGERFKMMIEKINNLINREYKLEIENKNNQLKVLQSQINPHFLYNALQSIGTVALKNKVPEIYTSLTDLSEIMRYGMNMDEGIVQLEKELNYSKAYLLLQKQRFGDDFEFTIKVDPQALQIKVPKMIMQPIIENYFKHGFDSREGVGNLVIECTISEPFVIMTIRDNGLGVSEERLKEIQRHFYAKHNRGREDTNIGLKNVFVRLKLYYSNQATLRLNNLEGGGFEVMMKLPIHLEEVFHEGDHY
ncbi:sensor histidine kinase [Bacillus alkalicellulosilyticus]|uniref:sensor histidine kinase n=1 Tax=Alkalihalobacterium alkalicellulosilyticum TaxID=1912214 RepID=UPI0009980B24|nr:sensor histidine kinase [Bacillus alkalicellulosilyticus]